MAGKKTTFYLFFLSIFCLTCLLAAQTDDVTAKLEVERAAKECALCHLQWMGVEVVSFDAAPEKAAVSEEMCYSCHDGTVLDSRSITWTNHQHPTNVIPSEKISIPPDYPLTEDGKTYCGTCHIPHNVSGKPGAGQGFLREYNRNSEMCRLCHAQWTKNDLFSNHSLDRTNLPIPQTILDAGGKTGVKKNQLICQTCHIVHSSPQEATKLLVLPLEKTASVTIPLCEQCHTENPSRPERGLGMDSHPVNVVPSKAVIPESWSSEKKTYLSKEGNITCRTCHKPHFGKPKTKILVEEKMFGKLCKKCHPTKNNSGTGELNRGSHPIDVAKKGKKPQPPLILEDGLVTCNTCHRTHNAADNAGIDKKDGKMLVRSNYQSSLCDECHDDKEVTSLEEAEARGTHPVKIKPNPEIATITEELKNLGASTGKNGEIICQSCHRVHDGVPGTSNLVVANVDAALCKQCHQKYPGYAKGVRVNTNHPTDMIPQNVKVAEIFKESGALLSRKKEIICTTCHRVHKAVPNSKLQVVDKKGGEFCRLCHVTKRTILSTEHNLKLENPEVPNVRKQTPQTAGVCSACHLMHQGKGPRMWARDLPSEDSDLSALCISCHQAEKVAEKKQVGQHSHKVNIKPSENIRVKEEVLPLYNDQAERSDKGKVFCQTCHDPHQWDPFQPVGPSKNTEGTASNSFLRVPNDANSSLCTSCHRDRFPQNSEHDLAITAPDEKNILGQLVSDSGVCSACHLVHNAQGIMLWGKELSGKGDPFSQLCESCHAKGKIAVKKIVGEHSHPVGIKMFATEKALELPLFSADGQKTPKGNVYCATCHNSHQWDPALETGGLGKNVEGNMSNSFLRISNQRRDSPLCRTCHDDRYPEDTAHDMQVVSPLEQNAQGKTTLETGICSACHLPHNGNSVRMWARPIKKGTEDPVSDLCVSCHEKEGLARTKIPEPYSHPLGVSFTRQKELPELPLYDENGKRDEKGKVGCASCHNPHQWDYTKKQKGPGFLDEGNINTSFLRRPNQESQLCKACHLDRRIADTDHDMRVNAPDEKNKKGFTVEQTGICSACHLPHGGGILRMWARDKIGEGNLIAQLCRSCHSDNRIAEKKQTGIIFHPIDVPITNPDLKLSLPLFDNNGSYIKEKGEMACATCHNVHRWDATSDDYGPGKNIEGNGNNSFLRIRNDLNASLCGECHPEKTVIVGTDHDMSVTAPKEKNILGFTAEESGSCSACHLVHNALDIKLWGRTLGESDDLINSLCLSCHSAGRSAEKKVTGKYTHSLGIAILEKGMTTTLPLFTEDGFEDINGVVSCATCHNAHTWNANDPRKGLWKNIEGDGSNSFLRKSNQKTASLCVDCHQKQGFLIGTDHDLAVTAPDEKNIKGNSAILSGACSACHLTHNGNDVSRWARPMGEGVDFASRICFSCHKKDGAARTKLMGENPHPMNVRPTQKGMSTTLPLFTKDGKQTIDGEIVCFTCHDIHQWSPELIMEEGGEEEKFIQEKDIRPGIIGRIAFIMGSFVYVNTNDGFEAQVGQIYVLYREGKLYGTVKVTRVNPIAKTFEAFCEILKTDLPVNKGDLAINQALIQFGLGDEGTGQNSYLRRPNDGSTQICLNCHENKRTIINTNHDLVQKAPDAKNSFGVTPQESGACSPCHLIHKSKQSYLLSYPLAEKGEPYGKFCSSCHNLKGTAKRKTIQSHHKRIPFGKPLDPSKEDASTEFPVQMPGSNIPLFQESTGVPKYERISYVTCPSCHNVHQWDPEHPLNARIEEGTDKTSFLRVVATANRLCGNCHLSGVEKVFDSIPIAEEKKTVAKPQETSPQEVATPEQPIDKKQKTKKIEKDITLEAPLITLPDLANDKVYITSHKLTVKGTILDEPPITSAVLILNGIQEDILVINNKFSVERTINEGSNFLKIMATDEDGNTGFSPEIEVIGDTQPPKIINYIYPEPKIGRDFYIKIVCDEELDTQKPPLIQLVNSSGESPVISGGRLTAQYYDKLPPEIKKRESLLREGDIDSQNPSLSSPGERITIDKTRYYTYRSPVNVLVHDSSYDLNPGKGNDELVVTVTSPLEPDGEDIDLREFKPGKFKGVFGFETIRVIGFDFTTQAEYGNRLIGVNDGDFFEVSYGGGSFEKTVIPNDSYVSGAILLDQEMAGELNLIIRDLYDKSGNVIKIADDKFIAFHPEAKLGFHEKPTIKIIEGETTRVRDIHLMFKAFGATQMKTSENEDLSDAKWVMFRSEIPYQLSEGNGSKRIHAVFKNEWGYESAQVSTMISFNSISFKKTLSGRLDSDLELTTSDTPVLLNGKLVIPKGKQLKIGAGVEILVVSTTSERGSLVVEGQLILQGISGQPIAFKSYEVNPKAGDWDGIVFNIPVGTSDKENLIKQVDIQHATVGVTLSPTPIKIEQNVFSNNLTAIFSPDNSTALIQDNTFTDNLNYAIVCRYSNPQIKNNKFTGHKVGIWCQNTASPLISDNFLTGNEQGIRVENLSAPKIWGNTLVGNQEKAIFIRKFASPPMANNIISENKGVGVYIEQASPMMYQNLIKSNRVGIYCKKFYRDFMIMQNSIFDNLESNLKLVDYSQRINAQKNWWGTTNRQAISQSIYDYEEDKKLGKVLYLPTLDFAIDQESEVISLDNIKPEIIAYIYSTPQLTDPFQMTLVASESLNQHVAPHITLITAKGKRILLDKTKGKYSQTNVENDTYIIPATKLSAEDGGTIIIEVKNMRDLTGNVLDPVSTESFYFETAITAKEGNYVNKEEIELLIYYENATEMRLGNKKDLSNAQWIPYKTTHSFTLPAGDGRKVVYVQFRIEDKTLSAIKRLKVVLDTAGPQRIKEEHPVPRPETPFFLSFVFNETLNTKNYPEITLIAENNKELVIPEGGEFSKTTLPNDTYTTPPVLLDRELGGQLRVSFGNLKDLAGNFYQGYYYYFDYDTKAPLASEVYLRVRGRRSLNTNSYEVELDISEVLDAADVIVSSQPNFANAKWEPYKPYYPFSALPPEGKKTVYLKFRDAVGNATPPITFVFTVDTTPPEISEFNYPDPAKVNKPFNISLLFNEGMNVSFPPQINLLSTGAKNPTVPPKGRFSTTELGNDTYTTPSITLTEEMAGGITIKVEEAQDTAGNAMLMSTEETFNLDIIPPVFSNLDVEPKITNQRKVTLFLTASGADQAIISEDPSFPVSNKITYQLIVDSVDPFSMDIMAEKLWEISPFTKLTDSQQIMMQLRSFPGIFIEEDNIDNIKKITEVFDDYDAISRINKKEGDWQLFSERLTYEFSEGDGEKHIHVNVRDAADNRPTKPLSVKVVYDTVKPQITIFQYPETVRLEEPFTVSLKMDKQMNPSLKPSIIFASTTGESQRIPATGVFSTVEKPYDLYTSPETILSRILEVGELSFTIKGMEDYLGNPLSPPSPQPINLDTEAIYGTGIAIKKWRFTNSRNLNLVLGSPDAKYRMLSEKPDFPDAKWEPLEANPQFYITQPDGYITLYAKFKTEEGKESVVVKGATLLDTTSPRIVKLKYPVPKISNDFELSIQFNESLNPEKLPVVILRSSGKKDPIVPLEGHFTSTVYPNDTYVTPKITLDRFMLGRIMVILKDAEDIHFNKMSISTENFFNFQLEWFALAPVVVKEGEHVNKLAINLILSPYKTADWIRVSELKDFSNYSEDEWDTYSKELPYKLWRNPEKPEEKGGKESLADAFRKKYGKKVIMEGERTIYVLFSSEITESSSGGVVITTEVSEVFTTKVILDTTPPTIMQYDFPSPQMDKPFQVALVFNESLSSKYEPQVMITTARGEKFPFAASGLFQTTLKPNDTYLSAPISIETMIKGLPQLEVRGARDFAGNAMAVATNLKPSGISVIEGSFCGKHDISLYLNLKEVTAIQASENPSFENVAWQDWRQQLPFHLSEGDGEKNIYLRSKNLAGEISEPKQVKVVLDIKKPELISYDFSLPLETSQPFSIRFYFDETINPEFLPTVTLQSGRQKKEIKEKGKLTTTRQTNDTYITLPITIDETMRNNIALTISGARDWANNQMNQRSNLKPTFLKIAEGELTNLQDIHLLTATSEAKFTYIIASEKSDFAGSEWSIFHEKYPFKLSPKNGGKTIYVKYKDDQGNTTSPVSVKVNLDTQPPQVLFYDFPTPTLGSPFKVLTVFNEPLDSAREPRLLVTSSGTNPRVKGKGSFITTNNPNDTYTSANIPLSFENGGKWEIRITDVYDLAGNKLEGKDSLMQTTTLKTITSFASSVLLEEGDYIKSPEVNLLLTAEGAVTMMLSEDQNFYGAEWEDYQEEKKYEFKISSAEKFAIEKGYSLSEDALRKTIYIQFRDNVGQVSKQQQITTTFDLVKPTLVTSTLVKPNDLSVVYSQPLVGAPFSIALNFSETLNNLKKPSIVLTAESGAQLTIPANGYFLITRMPKDTYLTSPITLNKSFGGMIRMTVTGAEDLAGNEIEPQIQTLIMDTTPPVITSFKAKEGLTVNTSHIHLLIKGKDIHTIKASEDPSAGVWQPLKDEIPFTLTPGAGYKYIYLLAKDESGNIASASSISLNQTLALSVSELQGELTESLTLIKENSPYMIRGNLIIPKGITMTIEAGTRVFVAARKMQEKITEKGKITVNGRLLCKGEEANPVVLTTAALEPPIEHWEGITFTNFNDKEQSILNYTVIQYATEGIFSRSSSPRIKNCQLSDNRDYAIHATQFSSPRINNTLISGSKISGVLSNGSTPYIKDSYFTRNDVGLISENNYGSSKPVLENCLFENNREEIKGPVEKITGKGLSPIAPMLEAMLILPGPTGVTAEPPPTPKPIIIKEEVVVTPTAEKPEEVISATPAAIEEPEAEKETTSTATPTEIAPLVVIAPSPKEPETVEEFEDAKEPPTIEEKPEVLEIPEVKVSAAPPLDKTPPQLKSFKVKEGKVVSVREITLLIKAKDAESMRLAEHSEFSDQTPWQPFSKQQKLTLPPEEGEYIISIQLQDKAENRTEMVSIPVTFSIPDTTHPTVLELQTPRPDKDNTTLQVTTVFSESMDTTVKPRLLLKDGRRQIKIRLGNWQKTNRENDTYVSKTVDLNNNLEGEISLQISHAVDLAGNKQAKFKKHLFLFDISPPRLTSLRIKEGKEVPKRDITLLIRAKEADSMRLDEHSKFSDSTPWQPYKKQIQFTLPEEEGHYKISLQLQDKAGNKTEIISIPVKYFIPDISRPQVVKIHAPYPKEGSTELQVKAVFSESMDSKTIPRLILKDNHKRSLKVKEGSWQKTSKENDTYLSKAIDLKGNLEGEISVEISRAVDLTGNMQSPYQQELFFFDITPPTLSSLSIKEGKVIAVRDLTVLLNAKDAHKMRFATTPEFSTSNWQPFAKEVQLTLPAKEGDYVIELQLQDEAGNKTEIITIPVTYHIPDVTRPLVKAVKLIGAAAKGEDFTLSLEFSESLNPDKQLQIILFIGKEKLELAQKGKFTKTNTANDTYLTPKMNLKGKPQGEVSLAISLAEDMAGNVMKSYLHTMFTFDLSPPELITFKALEGKTTQAQTIHLLVDAKDAYQMRIAEIPDLAKVKWQPLQKQTEFMLSEKPETKTIHLQLQDKAENQTEIYVLNITYELPPPVDKTPPKLENLKIIGRADRGKPFRLRFEFNESLDRRSTPKFIFTNNKKYKITRSGGRFQKTKLENDTYLTEQITLDKRLQPHVFLQFSGFKDSSDNAMPSQKRKLFDFDITPPRLKRFFCEEGAVIQKRIITLNILADEARNMRLSEDKSFSDSSWVAFNEKPRFTISEKAGAKRIYLQLTDASDNISELYSVNLTYTPPLPKNHLKGNLSDNKNLVAGQSPYVIHGLLTVEKGVTLSIEPGTTLQFLADEKKSNQKGGLLVLGELQAVGKEKKLITFTSVAKRPGAWSGIILRNQKEIASRMEYCRIEYAENGLICFGSSPLISNSFIMFNKLSGIAATNMAAPRITSSEISHNKIGLDLKRAYPRIEDCYIHDNQIGIRTRKNNYKKIPQLLNVRFKNNHDKDIQGEVEIIKPVTTTPAPPKVSAAQEQPAALTLLPQKPKTAPQPPEKTIPFVIKKLEHPTAEVLQPFTVKVIFSKSLNVSAQPTITLIDKSGRQTTLPKGQFKRYKLPNDTYTTTLKLLKPQLKGPLVLHIKGAKDKENNPMKTFIGENFPLISPTPEVLDLSISEGEKITMPLVNLIIKAERADKMMISESPYYENSVWLPFKEETIFEVTPDDGPKSIFVKLKSKAGIEGRVSQVDTFLELFSGTRIKGEINEDFLLKAADSPYLVKGTLVVPKGKTLTIEANTVIKFASLTIDGRIVQEGGLLVQGRLEARGTEEKPIVFTSAYPRPNPNDWEGIRFNNTSGEEYSLIESAIIEYAKNGITCSTSAPIINKCQIRFNNGYGVMLLNFSEARLFNNVIANNKKAGLYCNKSGPTLAMNTFSNNEVGIIAENLYASYPKVYQNHFTANRHGDVFGKFTTLITAPTLYPSTPPPTPEKAKTIKQTSRKIALGKTILRGSVSANVTLEPSQSPYLIMGRYVILKKSMLTIKPGVKLIFVSLKEGNMEESGALIVEGKLIARGTRNAPVIFTSAPEAAQGGSWKGIQLINDDRSTVSVIEYARIENANTGIFIRMAAAEISNSTIRNNKNGIFCSNYSSPKIYKNKITDNAFYGILCRQTTAEINDNIITRNDIGLKMPFNHPKPSLNNNKIVGNYSQEILSE